MVRCPADDSNDKWSLTGQTLEIEAPYMTTVKGFKALIAEKTGLPVGSQKLKTTVFLKAPASVNSLALTLTQLSSRRPHLPG